LDKKGVVAGGDTLSILRKIPNAEFSVIQKSTGGGVVLELFSGKNLPGIEALK
jgi:3-phosphoglycerate kinase